MDELLLMNLNTVVACNMRMGMKEDNPGLKKIKRDNSKKLIICVCEARGMLCDLTHSSSCS